MALQIVSHYGIHEKRGVRYLMQGRSGTNAIGMREAPPFAVKLLDRKRHCNHQIPLTIPVPNDFHWNFFLEILKDPLVQALLPVPKEGAGAFFVEDQGPAMLHLLINLSKMNSPIYNVVVPIWTMTQSQIMAELQYTNVQPLVLTMVEPKHSELLSQIGKVAAYAPRRVLFVGTSDVVVTPPIVRIQTMLLNQQYDPIDFYILPYDALGATALRKYMRGEWPIEQNVIRALPAYHEG